MKGQSEVNLKRKRDARETYIRHVHENVDRASIILGRIQGPAQLRHEPAILGEVPDELHHQEVAPLCDGLVQGGLDNEWLRRGYKAFSGLSARCRLHILV